MVFSVPIFLFFLVGWAAVAITRIETMEYRYETITHMVDSSICTFHQLQQQVFPDSIWVDFPTPHMPAMILCDAPCLEVMASTEGEHESPSEWKYQRMKQLIVSILDAPRSNPEFVQFLENIFRIVETEHSRCEGGLVHIL